MGSSSTKYYSPHCDQRRRRCDVGTNFSKEYSNYWSGTSKYSSDFSMERNAYSSQAGAYSSPRDNRRHSQFVSSFGKS